MDKKTTSDAAKKHLQQIKILDIKITQLQKEYDKLTHMKNTVKGINYGERVQTSPDGQGFTRIVDELIDRQNELNNMIDQFVNYRLECIKHIHSLDRAEYVEILYRRYVEYKSFEQIAYELNFSYAYVIQLHGGALEAYDRQI